jgi:flagellin
MSELAVLAQDVTKSTDDRALYNQEFNTLASYIKDVGTKEFNGVSLFDGTSLNVTVDSEANKFAMTGVNLLGSTSYTAVVGAAGTTTASDSIADVTSAQTALGHIKTAISQLAADRASIGSNIESLTMYSDQLGTLKNNLSAANSRITDVDVAQESTNYAKYNILVQTGTAMLAQANALPQSALRLLQ